MPVGLIEGALFGVNFFSIIHKCMNSVVRWVLSRVAAELETAIKIKYSKVLIKLEKVKSPVF